MPPKRTRKPRTPEYASWTSMKQRCLNPNNPSWKHYGGRGIEICDRWRDSYAAFLEDMGERPEGASLDRIDNDGNYEPSNCRWATTHEQQANKRVREDQDPVRLAFLYPCLRRQVGIKAHAWATAELRRLIPMAAAEGRAVADIARWAGMTRRAVYQVLDMQMTDDPKTEGERMDETEEYVELDLRELFTDDQLAWIEKTAKERRITVRRLVTEMMALYVEAGGVIEHESES